MQGKISLPHSNFAAKNASQIRRNALASGAPAHPLAAISFSPVTSLTTFLMLPMGLAHVHTCTCARMESLC